MVLLQKKQSRIPIAIMLIITTESLALQGGEEVIRLLVTNIDIPRQPGDSGGPLFWVYAVCNSGGGCTTYAWVLGILTGSDLAHSYYSQAWDVLQELGVNIYSGR